MSRRGAPYPGILIVDDDPDDLFALRATLDRLDVEIVEAFDGEEALRALLARDFSLVIMDLRMPRLSGYETAAIIRERERFRDLPILILSGMDPGSLRAQPCYQPELEVLSKPVPPETLRQKVVECLARRSASTPPRPRA